MPFDATPQEVKPGAFTLDALIAWLEKQDPMEKYDVALAKGCLLGKYVLSNGGQVAKEQGTSLGYSLGLETYPADFHEMPAYMGYVATGNWDNSLRPGPHTFGDALERAREVRG